MEYLDWHLQRLPNSSFCRSVARDIQQLVSQDQIVSCEPPLWTDGQTDRQTDNYNFSIIVIYGKKTLMGTQQ